MFIETRVQQRLSPVGAASVQTCYPPTVKAPQGRHLYTLIRKFLKLPKVQYVILKPENKWTFSKTQNTSPSLAREFLLGCFPKYPRLSVSVQIIAGFTIKRFMSLTVKPTPFVGAHKRTGFCPPKTIGVNLGVSHDILQQRLYRCRPAGAWLFGVPKFYTDVAPLGLKTVHSPHIIINNTIRAVRNRTVGVNFKK